MLSLRHSRTNFSLPNLIKSSGLGSMTHMFSAKSSALEEIENMKAFPKVEKMFCFQCQETKKGTGCTNNGICGKKGPTAVLQDYLVTACRDYAIALNGKVSNEAGRLIMRSLFVTVTNVNFDDDAIAKYIKDVYYAAEKVQPGIKSAPAGVLSEDDIDKRSLIELICYGVKGSAAYVEHAACMGFEDNSLYTGLVNMLAESSRPHSVPELINLVLETGKLCVRAMEILDRANRTSFGDPEAGSVRTSVEKRPGILVSGHDLIDIKMLLEQTEGTGIDVYTHGEMLPAHFYPKLKKHKHLIGNYGGPWFNQDKEFGPFNGPILMTSNCIIPVQKSYKDRIFTTGTVGWPGLRHIEEKSDGTKDFSPLIELAKTCKPPVQLDDTKITGGFAHGQVTSLLPKILDAVKSGKIKKFVCMGGCDGRDKRREYYTELAQKLPHDHVILTAGCAKYRYNKLNLGDIDGIPRVIDAGQCNDSYSLALIALALKDAVGASDVNDLPLAFDIAWYEQKAACVLLGLISLGFKNIRVGPTLPAFVSPNVLKVLQDNFNLMGIKDVETDLQSIINGK